MYLKLYFRFMNADIQASPLSGCYTITLPQHNDMRGSFVKTFHPKLFSATAHLPVFKEQYYSVSHQNVFRGMHFQLPPFDVVKLVYCSQGMVYDFVADLRKTSPTYGHCHRFELSGEHPTMVVIPSGMAHGFLTRSQSATLHYMVSEIYNSELDTGIHYSSFSIIDLPFNAHVSLRDQAFVKLSDFNSPF
jgi:dTDP-4-dehydrorhamnose 3,5-epimerase